MLTKYGSFLSCLCSLGSILIICQQHWSTGPRCATSRQAYPHPTGPKQVHVFAHRDLGSGWLRFWIRCWNCVASRLFWDQCFHVAWLGRKKQFRLGIFFPETHSLSQPESLESSGLGRSLSLQWTMVMVIFRLWLASWGKEGWPPGLSSLVHIPGANEWPFFVRGNWAIQMNGDSVGDLLALLSDRPPAHLRPCFMSFLPSCSLPSCLSESHQNHRPSKQRRDGISGTTAPETVSLTCLLTFPLAVPKCSRSNS